MTIACKFGAFYWTPLINNSKISHLYLALGLLFDSLWCLGEASFYCYRVTPFKLLKHMHIFYKSCTEVHFHMAFSKIFSVSYPSPQSSFTLSSLLSPCSTLFASLFPVPSSRHLCFIFSALKAPPPWLLTCFLPSVKAPI